MSTEEFIDLVATGVPTEIALAIQTEVNVNRVAVDGDWAGNFPVQVAVFLDRPDVVKILLSAGARRSNGFRAISPTTSWDTISLLMPDSRAVNERDEDGYTPLMVAAAIGSEKLVLQLVKQGGDVNLSARDGTTALIVAASKGNLDLALALWSMMSSEAKANVPLRIANMFRD